MSAMNREQGLFVATLAICGYLTWSTISDAYKPQPAPPRKYLDPAETIGLPDMQLASADQGRFDPAGRDFFQPPKDWNPLPPMVLDTPPLPEILAVGPLTDPAVEPDLYAAYRHAPLGAGGGVGGGGGVDEGGRPSTPVGSGAAPTGDDVSGGGADESLYDWIKPANGPRRFGFIRNKDKVSLLDSRDAVLFEAVDLKRGTGFGGGKGSPFERDKLAGNGAYEQGFGFADTVATRFALLKREVRPTVGNVAQQLEAARTALGWRADNEAVAVEAAEWFVDTALSFQPASDQGWLLKARIRRLALDTEGELEAYARAEQAGARTAGLLVGRARALARLGLYEAAAALLADASALAPADIEPYIELGRLRLEQGRAADAITALKKADDVGGAVPLRVEARVLLARAYLARGDQQGALGAAERVFALDQENEAAYVVRGVVALLQGDATRARGEFAGALEANPRSRDAVFNLAVAATLEGDADEARARYQEAADLSPLQGFASAAGIGVLEELMGDLPRAAEQFEEALELHPNQPYGLYRAGRAARRLQDIETAQELLTRSLEVDGRILDVLNELALVAILDDRPAEAEVYSEESLLRDPENAEVLVLLGDARLRQGRIRDARDAFEQAAARVGDGEFRLGSAAHAGIAFCRYREGDVQGALKGFAEARAAAEAEGDEFWSYADRNQLAIDDHHRKEQWIDVFDRAKVVNNWNVVEAFGPTVAIMDGQIRITGEQRNSEGGQRTELLRDINSKQFVLVEASVRMTATSEGMVGVRWVLERPASGGTTVPHAEISVAFDRAGQLYLYQRTGPKEAEVARNWDPIDMGSLTLDPASGHVLTIERVDAEEGVFVVKVDGRTLADGPAKDRSLAKLRYDSQGGPFVRADARRRVDASCDMVRIVRYQD